MPKEIVMKKTLLIITIATACLSFSSSALSGEEVRIKISDEELRKLAKFEKSRVDNAYSRAQKALEIALANQKKTKKR